MKGTRDCITKTGGIVRDVFGGLIADGSETKGG